MIAAPSSVGQGLDVNVAVWRPIARAGLRAGWLCQSLARPPLDRSPRLIGNGRGLAWRAGLNSWLRPPIFGPAERPSCVTTLCCSPAPLIVAGLIALAMFLASA